MKWWIIRRAPFLASNFWAFERASGRSRDAGVLSRHLECGAVELSQRLEKIVANDFGFALLLFK